MIKSYIWHTFLIEYIVRNTPKTNNPFHELFYLGVPIQYVYYITCNHIQCILLSLASFLEMHLNFHLKSTLLLSICSKNIKFEIFSVEMVSIYYSWYFLLGWPLALYIHRVMSILLIWIRDYPRECHVLP